MPPPSPVPGWANGDVCNESIATRLGDIQRPIQVTGLHPFFRAPQGAVEVDEDLLLAVVEVGGGLDRVLEIGGWHAVVVAGIEDPGPDVQRLGGDREAPRDLLQDVGAGLAQAAFDLAQVRVRDAGPVAQAPQRQPGALALLANEVAEVTEPLLDAVG